MFVGKLVTVFGTIFLIAIVSDVCSEKIELYSDKYDYIDVDTLLNTPRLRNQYFKCLTETGPCMTPDAVFIKEHLPEAYVTKCKRCTERQKEIFDKVSAWFTENEPEQYKQIVAKTLENAKKQ